MKLFYVVVAATVLLGGIEYYQRQARSEENARRALAEVEGYDSVYVIRERSVPAKHPLGKNKKPARAFEL